MIDSWRGAAGAEDAQGTPSQSHMSLSILVYKDHAVLSHSVLLYEPHPQIHFVSLYEPYP